MQRYLHACGIHMVYLPTSTRTSLIHGNVFVSIASLLILDTPFQKEKMCVCVRASTCLVDDSLVQCGLSNISHMSLTYSPLATFPPHLWGSTYEPPMCLKRHLDAYSILWVLLAILFSYMFDTWWHVHALSIAVDFGHPLPKRKKTYMPTCFDNDPLVQRELSVSSHLSLTILLFSTVFMRFTCQLHFQHISYLA